MRSERPTTKLSRRLALIALLVVVAAGLVGPGCVPMGADAGFADTSGVATVDGRLMEAQGALANNQVADAQAIYGRIIAEYDQPPGAAYAGKALTDLLLLPGAPSATTLLVDHFGATSGIDADDALYAEEGFLYWQVRGVPWNDDESYAGIQSLIANELPWSKERLSSFRGFFEGLTTPANAMMDDLVLVADAIGQIENDLQRALEDPGFEMLYIPGRTFHYDGLDLLLGRSELHALGSTLAAMRGSIYFLAAYQHDWTLDEAFGAQTTARQQTREGWGVADYAFDYLDSRLARQVRDPLRLQEARQAFDESLTSAVAAIEVGLEAEVDTTIQWRQGDRAYAHELVEFLEAVRSSLHGPTELPGSTPKTTMNLALFFDGGRTLDADLRWFERIAPTDEAGGEAYWEISDAARQAFWVDGVFEPGFDVSEGGGPDLNIDDERAEKFLQAVGGDVENNVEDAYFTTQ